MLRNSAITSTDYDTLISRTKNIHQDSQGTLRGCLRAGKGQLISKRFLGFVNFLQKRTKTCLILVKTNPFVCFLEKIDDPKKLFEINWPLDVRRMPGKWSSRTKHVDSWDSLSISTLTQPRYPRCRSPTGFSWNCTKLSTFLRYVYKNILLIPCPKCFGNVQIVLVGSK